MDLSQSTVCQEVDLDTAGYGSVFILIGQVFYSSISVKTIMCIQLR